jgi:hypothetical protein
MSIRRIAKQGKEGGRDPSPTMDNSGGQQWFSGRGTTAKAQAGAWGDAKPARVEKEKGMQGLSKVLIGQGGRRNSGRVYGHGAPAAAFQRNGGGIRRN